MIVRRGELTVMDGKLAVVNGDRRRGLVQIPIMRPQHDVGWAAATGRPRRRRLPLAGEQACEGIPAAVASALALPDTRVRAGSPAAAAACGMGEGGGKGKEGKEDIFLARSHMSEPPNGQNLTECRRNGMREKKSSSEGM